MELAVISVRRTPVGSNDGQRVAEVGAGRVVALDLTEGSQTVLADGLQFGVALVRAPPTVAFPTGIAVGHDGTLYVSEDGGNAIVKIELK